MMGSVKAGDAAGRAGAALADTNRSSGVRPAFLAERLRRSIRARRLARLIAALERRNGRPVPDETLARIEREWPAD